MRRSCSHPGMLRASRVVCTSALLIIASGCASAPAEKVDPILAAQEAHRQQFGNFDLPRKIGTIENVGLQLPAISPDGQRILYLRTEQESLSPATIIGSSDPADTPSEGLLSIWIRSARGAEYGRRFSSGRWCHSATWSSTGRAVAYVSNEPGGAVIVCVDVATMEEKRLGLPAHVNCLPRFGPDDRTVLYCSGETSDGPWRVFRQTIDEQPVPLSPEGQDCVLPALATGDSAVCGQIEQGALHWVRSSTSQVLQLVGSVAPGDRPAFLQVWAGVTDPVSPDRRNLLYYDGQQGRIAVCDTQHGYVRRHRPGSIAACWLTPEVIALATPDRVCCVNAGNAMNLELMSGAWIPARYVRDERRLLLMGREGSSTRLSLYEIRFRSAATTAPAGGR